MYFLSLNNPNNEMQIETDIKTFELDEQILRSKKFWKYDNSFNFPCKYRRKINKRIQNYYQFLKLECKKSKE